MSSGQFSDQATAPSLDTLSDSALEAELIALRARLEVHIQELEARAEHAVSQRDSVQLDQSRVGRLSRIDAPQIKEMERALEERRHIDLLRAQRALSLMQGKEYGYCVICDEPIALKRVRLDPSLITCVTCA